VAQIFERPDEPRAIRVTSRDVALLENIGRLRLASTAQLAALDRGSARNVSRSLLAQLRAPTDRDQRFRLIGTSHSN
jgi:hypothetical protein